MLKSSKRQYQYQELREKIKTIVIKHIKLLKGLLWIQKNIVRKDLKRNINLQITSACECFFY